MLDVFLIGTKQTHTLAPENPQTFRILGRVYNMQTSKSAPELRCFVHFDFEMRFAPQRRALFHLSSGQLAPHPPL
jgi:hypothetical protein